MQSQYNKYSKILSNIDSLLNFHDTVLVAIDGSSGAGKSTLANVLSEVYDCNVFHMDDFFLRPELKTEERLKELAGNVDYVRFKEEVIVGLNSGQEFKYQIYDCKQMALTNWVSVVPKKLNIIEGSYSMHPTLIDNYHLKIFLHINPEEQSLRILKRNGPIMHRKFLSLWVPLENKYFSEMNIAAQSNLVFEV